MNIVEKILALGEGSHRCGWGAGYIRINPIDFYVYQVIWTTNEDYHSFYASLPAVCIEYTIADRSRRYTNPDGSVSSEVYKSAITMHKVNKLAEKEQILKFLKEKINQAHDRKEQGTWLSRIIKKLRKWHTKY